MFLELSELIKRANKLDSFGLVKEANALDNEADRIINFLKDYTTLPISDKLKMNIKASKLIFNRVESFKKLIAAINPLNGSSIKGSKYNINLHDWLLDPTGEKGQEFEKLQLLSLRLRAMGYDVDYQDLGDDDYESSIASISPQDARELLTKLELLDSKKRSVSRKTQNSRETFPGMPYSSYANLMGSVLYGDEFSSKEFSQFDEKEILNELLSRSEGVIQTAGGLAAKGKDNELKSEMASIARQEFFKVLMKWKKEGSSSFDDHYKASMDKLQDEGVSDFNLIPSKISTYLKYNTRNQYKRENNSSFYTQHTPMEREIFANQDSFMIILQQKLDQVAAYLNTTIDDPRVYNYVMQTWDFSDLKKSPFYPEDLDDSDDFFEEDEEEGYFDFLGDEEQEIDYSKFSQYQKNRLRSWFDNTSLFKAEVKELQDEEKKKKKNGEEHISWITDNDLESVLGQFRNSGMLYRFALYKIKLDEKVKNKNKYNNLSESVNEAYQKGDVLFPNTGKNNEAFKAVFPSLRLGVDKNTGELSMLSYDKSKVVKNSNNKKQALSYMSELVEADNKSNQELDRLRDALMAETDPEKRQIIEERIEANKINGNRNGLKSLQDYASRIAYEIAVKQKAAQKTDGSDSIADANGDTRKALENLAGDPEYQETIEKKQIAGELDVELNNFYNQDGIEEEAVQKKQDILLNSFINHFLEENGKSYEKNDLGGKKNLNINNSSEKKMWFNVIKGLYKDYADRQSMDSYELSDSQDSLIEKQFIDYLESKNGYQNRFNIERIEVVDPYLPAQESDPTSGRTSKKMNPGRSKVWYDGVNYSEDVVGTPEWYHFEELKRTADEIDTDGDDDTIVNEDGRFSKRIYYKDVRKARDWVNKNKDSISSETVDINHNLLEEYENSQDLREFSDNKPIEYLKMVLYDDEFWSSVKNKIGNMDRKQLKETFGMSSALSSNDFSDLRVNSYKLLSYLHYGMGIPKKSLGLLTYNPHYNQIIRKFDDILKIYNEPGFEGSSGLGREHKKLITGVKSGIHVSPSKLNERFKSFSNAPNKMDIDVAIDMANKYVSNMRVKGGKGVNNYLKDAGVQSEQFNSWYLMNLNNVLKSIEMGAIDSDEFYNGYDPLGKSQRATVQQMLGDYSDLNDKIVKDITELDKDFYDNKKLIMKNFKGEEQLSELANLKNDYENGLNNLFIKNQFDLTDYMEPFFESNRSLHNINQKTLRYANQVNEIASESGSDVNIDYIPADTSNSQLLLKNYAMGLENRVANSGREDRLAESLYKLSKDKSNIEIKEENDPYRPVHDMDMPISHSIQRMEIYKRLVDEEKKREFDFLDKLTIEQKARLLSMDSNKRRIELRSLVEDIHKGFWDNPIWRDVSSEDKKDFLDDFKDEDEIYMDLENMLNSLDDEVFNTDVDNSEQENIYDIEQFDLDIINQEPYNPVRNRVETPQIDDLTFENARKLVDYIETSTNNGFAPTIDLFDGQSQYFMRQNNFQIDKRSNEAGQMEEVLVGPPAWYTQEVVKRQVSSNVSESLRIFSSIEINNILNKYGY